VVVKWFLMYILIIQLMPNLLPGMCTCFWFDQGSAFLSRQCTSAWVGILSLIPNILRNYMSINGCTTFYHVFLIFFKNNSPLQSITTSFIPRLFYRLASSLEMIIYLKFSMYAWSVMQYISKGKRWYVWD